MTASKFFIICPLGFEEEAKKELILKSIPDSILSCESITGGLLLETDLNLGLELNTRLKIPSRILLRLSVSTVRDLPKLYKKIGQVPWRDYLWDASSELHITCKKSRLINTSKIEATVKEALTKYFIDNPTKKKILEARNKISAPAIFLRFEDDIFTLSIDTSGELLHKRYSNKEIGEAPLRENLASALLLTLKEFATQDLLIDPMCGSGTFLKEASLFFSNSQRPFVYESFPMFKNTLVNKSPSKILPGLFRSYLGFDQDQKMIESAKQNAPDLKDAFTTRDLFAPVKNKLSGSLIINPPYNKRLKITDKNFYKKLQLSIEKNFNIDCLGLIIPRDVIDTLNLKFLQKKISFRNGGIPLYYLLFKYNSEPGG